MAWKRPSVQVRLGPPDLTTQIMLNGFKQFILRGNVVDLAVGVVMGAAFGSVVTSFVEDVITPLIGAIVAVPDFSKLDFTLNGSTFQMGEFLNSLLSFLLIAFAVYFFVVTPMNRLLTHLKVATKVKPCPECLSNIPAKAKRCMYCTQAVD